MTNHITSALGRIRNLTGEELQREIAKEAILVRRKLEDIFEQLIEIKEQIKTK